MPEKVALNVAQIVKRAASLSQTASDTNLPAYQTIIDLISDAVNPRNLAQMDQLWSVRHLISLSTFANRYSLSSRNGFVCIYLRFHVSDGCSPSIREEV